MQNEKVYVMEDDNKANPYIQSHIRLGDKVIVKDGSYMKDEHGNLVTGIQFRKPDLFELLTVIEINTPFDTDYEGAKALRHQNNCCIEGADGKKYYCSRINITRFEQ